MVSLSYSFLLVKNNQSLGCLYLSPKMSILSKPRRYWNIKDFFIQRGLLLCYFQAWNVKQVHWKTWQQLDTTCYKVAFNAVSGPDSRGWSTSRYEYTNIFQCQSLMQCQHIFDGCASMIGYIYQNVTGGSFDKCQFWQVPLDTGTSKRKQISKIWRRPISDAKIPEIFMMLYMLLYMSWSKRN